jgi:hypothetical protein
LAQLENSGVVCPPFETATPRFHLLQNSKFRIHSFWVSVDQSNSLPSHRDTFGQDDDQPLGVFINHYGIKKYLTGSKIAKLLQTVARTVHPNMTREEISRFSSHSGRVWAVVLLDEAGMSPEFIKCRLRYLSDAYRLYLRDTSVIQSKHTDALNKDSEDIIKLLGENRMILPDIVPIENDMGEYTSEN